MATTERQRQLTAEHLNRTGTIAPVRVHSGGRPKAAEPEPCPIKTPFPAFLFQPDDHQPSETFSLGLGRPLSRGEQRGLAWYEAQARHETAYAKQHWAWKQRRTLPAKQP